MNTKRDFMRYVHGHIMTYVKLRDVECPKKAHDGDAWDLHIPKDFVPRWLEKNEIILIKLGIVLNLDVHYVAKVLARSGLALEGIAVVNGIGYIDSGYRGEIGVILVNLGTKAFWIKPNMRICQMAIEQTPEIDLREGSTIDITTRGKNGLGSTGI